MAELVMEDSDISVYFHFQKYDKLMRKGAEFEKQDRVML